MRLAVLADIHGNLRALEAVAHDLRRHAPDLIVNLGDHVSGPLQAAETADALMAHDYLHIRGNHDRQLLDRSIDAMGPSDRAASEQLTDRHKEWLRNLPPVLELDGGIFLCHGSPLHDLQYLLEEVTANGVALGRPDYIEQRLGDCKAPLVLCGHTHIPRLVTIGSTQILNPGSVGLPAYEDVHPRLHYMETGSPHARYAVLDRNGPAWRAQFVAIEYDWNAAAREAAERDRPDWAHALATGYALRS